MNCTIGNIRTLSTNLRTAGGSQFLNDLVIAFCWKQITPQLENAARFIKTTLLKEANTTQLSWAWSSATNAPFYSPYTGFHVELPDGTTILNYNEGFNSKMTDTEIIALGKRFKTDILLAGMQLDFIDDVVRGVSALKPQMVILFPPHEKFHEMMGVASKPWGDFAHAIRSRFPEIVVHVAEPGFQIDIPTSEASTQHAA